MSWFTEANDVLRIAVKEQIFDHRPIVIQRMSMCRNGILSTLMKAMDKQTASLPVVSPWLQKQSSWQLPATRRYVQSRFPPITPSVQPIPGANWMVELSRYPVAYGSIGIIKSLEQFVSQGQSLYSTSVNWGNPFALGIDLSWYLRLSPYARLNDPWINVSGAGVTPDRLPGFAYDDLSRTDDIWFPASSCSTTNVHLVIPGGYYLRVVAIVAANQGDPVSLACKLAGSVQLETNSDAQTTVRTSW
jgi:hypothetical protein